MAKIQMFKNQASHLQKAGRLEMIALWRRRPIRPNTVFYESFAGNGVLDNPEAIFRALLADPAYSDLRHIWALDDPHAHPEVLAEFAHDDRVSFVTYETTDYWRALSTSQYLINNSTFPYEFGKRAGQVYLNTWHGTPLKAMGYDMPSGGSGARNITRNFLAADYLLSTCPFMTDRFYRQAYRLQGLFPGTIIEEGYPRLDRQFIDDAKRGEIRSALRAGGVTVGEGKIVLYAPTWRGASFHNPEANLGQIRVVLGALQDRLGAATTVLLKVHQAVYDRAVGTPDLAACLVPNDMPTNAVLGITDVVITDYSSIFFDFLATGRRVFFYTPDLDDYVRGRGLYLEPKDWPGVVTGDVNELCDHVDLALETPDADPPGTPLAAAAERIAAARDTFCPHDDGQVSGRVIDVVFGGRTAGYRLHRDLDDERPSILIYLGGMLRNGITTSAMSLLDNIDHTKVDITVTFTDGVRQRELADELHPAVRLLPQIGGMNGTKLLHFPRKRLVQEGDPGRLIGRSQVDRQFREEWERCFGAAQFDHIVDFSGYSGFWDYLLLQGTAKTTTIWMHNDMAAEIDKKIDGQHRHKKSLTATFSLYSSFDKLVSVSPALADVNRRKLADYAAPEAFVSARNTINPERVIALARGGLDIAPTRAPVTTPPPINLAQAVERVRDAFGDGAFADEVERQTKVASVMPADPSITTFVTIGRLSPEKNQGRLIRAFARVHTERPDTHLVIIGSGLLEGKLRALADELGVGHDVTLAGHWDNPFALLRACDCFVLPSDYEGQPMVIMEARILGLPVIATAFESVASALAPDEGLVVPRTVDGVADGLRAFLAGKVPCTTFDTDRYNAEAVAEFFAAIGCDIDPRQDSTGQPPTP